MTLRDPALLTSAARLHIRAMLRAIAPAADALDSRFRKVLRHHEQPRIRALLAITPAAASRLRTIPAFLEQVDYSSRRLAKLNVPPDQVNAALNSFEKLLAPVLADRFQPAREQLRLATSMAVNDAYYDVRESETQALFGLYRAEAESAGMDDLLHRSVRILARAVRARSARVILSSPAPGPRPPGLVYSGLTWRYPVTPGVVFEFGFATPRACLPREAALLEAAAERCRGALERARLQSENHRLAAEARGAEEDERRRIGRELHDEAGQSLLCLRLQLEMMQREAAGPLASRLSEARGIAEHTVGELRRIIAALSPSVLERLGLRAALRHLASRFRAMHPAELRLRIASRLPSLPRRSEEAIYRTAQEALQNVAKHSQANIVKLSVQTSDKYIRLSVVDNGAGFCEDSAKSKSMSFGLAGMRERATLIGGALTVRSAPGKGAAVVLDLPRNPHR